MSAKSVPFEYNRNYELVSGMTSKFTIEVNKEFWKDISALKVNRIVVGVPKPGLIYMNSIKVGKDEQLIGWPIDCILFSPLIGTNLDYLPTATEKKPLVVSFKYNGNSLDSVVTLVSKKKNVKTLMVGVSIVGTVVLL